MRLLLLDRESESLGKIVLYERIGTDPKKYSNKGD